MDTIRLSEYCDHVLDLQNAKLSDEYFYQSLPLCVIDAVFSLGVKYQGTRQTVIRYCNYYKLRRIRGDKEGTSITEQESIKQFTEKMESAGIHFFTDKVFDNRQRTSSKNGILKTEAVLKFAKTLQKYKVNYLQDVPIAVHETEVEDDIRKIPGQKSGISLKYFFMLAGSEDLIKPDRWIKEFIKDAIEKLVSNQESQRLLSGACEKLKIKYHHLNPRLLDQTIWKYQRKKLKKERNQQFNQNKDSGRFGEAYCTQSLPFDGRERRITGRIVCPDTDRLEITINKNQDHGLPLKHGLRVTITLLIDGVTHEAGVRVTSQGIPWICPDLSDIRGQKVRLADALRRSSFKKGQKVFLTKCEAHGFKTFRLDHV